MAGPTTVSQPGSPLQKPDRRRSSQPESTPAGDFSDHNGIVSPHSLPPAVLRLLSLSSPLISAVDTFLQLATWTGPNGGGTRSTLLLLGWTGICLFSYPLLRYAPQVILLSVILGSAIPNVLLPPSSSKRKRKASSITIPTLSASTLTQTQAVELLQKLSSILDVCSTLHAHLVLPVWQALTWQHPGGPAVTIGTAIVCLTVGSAWTLCFADWPAAWGKVVTLLPLDPTWDLVYRGSHTASETIQQLWHAHFRAHYEQAGSPQFRKMLAFILVHSRDVFFWLAAKISAVLPGTLSLAVLPPFPLFSFSLSHFFLALGLLAFSWCSTYATLVRHALWKSAVIRRITRASVRLLSAGYLGQDTNSHYTRSLATSGVIGSKSATSGSSTATSSKADRINTVSYRFELYENQRWWMGLDWTAALLPQERASWTDVNLAPVSPPSSFTLPSETVTMRPAPTKEKPNAWEKRTVRWKWEEEEWRVVVNGTGAGGQVLGDDGQPLATTSWSPGARRASAGGQAGAPSSPTNNNTLFASFGKRTSVSSSPARQVAGAGTVEEPESVEDLHTPTSELADDDDTLLEEETDAQGWRYGDNSWEKLTSKSGMGKYTRRRRWVRRARMEEIVEGGLDAPSAGEKKGAVSGGAVEKTPVNNGTGTAASGEKTAPNALPAAPTSPQLPSSPTPGGTAGKKDLKARLAGAAGGGGNAGAGTAGAGSSSPS